MGVTSNSGFSLYEFITLGAPTPLGILTSTASGQLPNLSLAGNATVGGATLQFVNNNTGQNLVATFTSDVQIDPVPLPASVWLVLSGLLGLGALARKPLTNFVS